MSSSEELRTYAGRLATFDGPRQLTKRRASSTKKKTPNTASWPHREPTPEQLAKAGLYYRPTNTSPDSVTCFLCDKSLDGWTSDDNPALEHLSHVPDCGFAINVCIEQRSQDMDRAEEDPMSPKMAEARRATFQDLWPHETKKGWKCKTQKMVDAGWASTPLPDADDCVTCFYCGISLDGWEPKDDPWKEHRRRAPDCHFFSLVEESVALAKAAKNKKGRASRSSKSSRVSTQSAATIPSDRNSLGDLDGGIVQEEESIIVNPTAIAQKKGKGRNVGAKAKADTHEDPSLLVLEDSMAQEGDSILTAGTTTSKPGEKRKKATKAKTAPKQGKNTRKKDADSADEAGHEESQLVDSADADDESQIVVAKPKPTRPQKATRRGTKQRAASQQPEQSENTVEPAASRTRVRKKTPRVSDDVSQLHSELEAAASKPAAFPVQVPPKRGKKRMSNGSEKLDSSVIILNGQPKKAQSKPRVTSRSKKPPATAPPPDDEDKNEDEIVPNKPDGESASPAQSPPLPSKPPARGKKTRTASRQRKPETDKAPLTQPNLRQEQEPDAHRSISHPAELPSPETAPQMPPEPCAPPTPEATTKAPSNPMQKSPSGSPQSSNAENQPPSSRPSLSAKKQPLAPTQLSPTRIAAQAQEAGAAGICTPLASPSKRANTIGGALRSDAPWTAVDLENIFLPSPSHHQHQQRQQALGTTDKAGVTEAMEEVLRRVTEEERGMSVEEWILANAARAEEKLRGECEGLIGGFEGEGLRALRAVEGIEAL